MATRRRNRRRQTPRNSPPQAPTHLTPSDGASIRRTVLAVLALVAFALASYAPAMLWGGFVWDDLSFITAEPALEDLAGLKRIWFAPMEVEEPFYRPLTYTTFWLEHKLWGFTPNGYHVVNVLLHAANAVLLWRILLALAVPGAWVVAAVFVVHPLHVESVAWAIERKDMLSGLLYLACVATWLRFLAAREAAGRRTVGTNWRLYGLALALLTAGLLAKNMVATLPAALLILQWWRSGRVNPTDIALVLPFFLVAAAFAALDLQLVSTKTPAEFDFSFVERLLIAARAVWFYVGKLAWPADLAVIYTRWDVQPSDPLAWLPLVAGLAVAAALWLQRGRLGRGPLAGALFFVVTLSPTLGFVNHTYMLFAFVADRYQYLAGIGALAVAIGAGTVAGRRLPDAWRRAAAVGGVAVLVLLGALTWRQAAIYRDETTFFQHIVATNPDAVGAHLNLSKALFMENRFEEALAAARIAVAQRPDSHDALVNLAAALGELERYDEAEPHLRRAIALAPEEETAEPLNNLVALLYRRGDKLVQNERHDDAIAGWREALTHTADPSIAFSLHIKMGRAEWARSASAAAAAPHYERALAIDESEASVLGDLASLRIAQQRYADATTLFQRALEQTPDAARFHAGLGYALYASGQANAAIASLERALALDADLDEARAHLALARRSAGAD